MFDVGFHIENLERDLKALNGYMIIIDFGEEEAYGMSTFDEPISLRDMEANMEYGGGYRADAGDVFDPQGNSFTVFLPWDLEKLKEVKMKFIPTEESVMGSFVNSNLRELLAEIGQRKNDPTGS